MLSLSSIMNRPTGVKIALGMVLLVILAGCVGGIGLFAISRMGGTIDVAARSSDVLVDVHNASSLIENFRKSQDFADADKAQGLLKSASSTLTEIGGEQGAVSDANTAIGRFETAIAQLVDTTNTIKQTTASQRDALKALDASASKTLEEAQSKNAGARKALVVAEKHIAEVRDLIAAAGAVQVNAYRANGLILQAQASGDSKALKQAALSIRTMAKPIGALLATSLPALDDKIKGALKASSDKAADLVGRLQTAFEDTSMGASEMGGAVGGQARQMSVALSNELDAIGKVATRAGLGLNKEQSAAIVEVERAGFTRDEAELAANTGRAVAVMAKRIEAGTAQYQLYHSDVYRSQVQTILDEAEALGLELARAGASDVSELFASYKDSFTRFSAAMQQQDTSLEDARTSSVEATRAIDTLISLQRDASFTSQQRSIFAVVLVLLIAMVVAVVIAVVLTRIIGRPIARLASSMLRLADGETELELAHSERKDEIGAMQQAVMVFRDNAVERNRLAERQREEDEAQRNRTETISRLISSFRQEVEEKVSALNANATQMDDTASSLTEVSDGATRHADQVSRASNSALDSVTTVASAAEELTASIAEIGRQAATAKSVVTSASQSATSMSSRIGDLQQSASRIGDVVELIKAIAEQTNLLALNATIEAARAGEMGKGFAVVAAEVKELSNQTSKATEEIVEQVAAIQAATEHAVGAVSEITETMDQANNVTATIASAVVEQEAATAEISQNAQQAAQGTGEAASDTGELLAAVRTTASEAEKVLQASREVNQHSRQLRESIETFLDNVSNQ